MILESFDKLALTFTGILLGKKITSCGSCDLRFGDNILFVNNREKIRKVNYDGFPRTACMSGEWLFFPLEFRMKY